MCECLDHDDGGGYVCPGCLPGLRAAASAVGRPVAASDGRVTPGLLEEAREIARPERLRMLGRLGVPTRGVLVDEGVEYRIAEALAWRDRTIAEIHADRASEMAAADAVRAKVREAMKYANGRWCEWGPRATLVSIMLEHAIGDMTDEQRDEQTKEIDW